MSHFIVIVFSLLNSNEFCAKAENESTNEQKTQTINVIRNIPGVRFDWKLSCFVFPLTSHDILGVALAKAGFGVKSLPRKVISALQVNSDIISSSSSSSSTSPNTTSDNTSSSSVENTNNIVDNSNTNADNIIVSTNTTTKVTTNTTATTTPSSSSSSLDLINQICPESVLKSLAGFQKEAVAFVASKGGRAIIADEMGLGKTRSAIACTMLYKEDWPVLIVVPSTARYHWQAELLNILGPIGLMASEILLIDRRPSLTVIDEYNVPKFMIISYNMVIKLENLITQELKNNIIIVDECHYMKNNQAQRTKALTPLIKASKRAILLSGTPALSRPLELFTQLHSLQPLAWPNEKEFGQRYCNNRDEINNNDADNSYNNRNNNRRRKKKKKKVFFNKYAGASNTQELHLLLKNTIMIRRLKTDVVSQLPVKCRVQVLIDIMDVELRDELKSIMDAIRQIELDDRTRRSEMRKRKRLGTQYFVDEATDVILPTTAITTALVPDVAAEAHARGAIYPTAAVPVSTNSIINYVNSSSNVSRNDTGGNENGTDSSSSSNINNNNNNKNMGNASGINNSSRNESTGGINFNKSSIVPTLSQPSSSSSSSIAPASLLPSLPDQLKQEEEEGKRNLLFKLYNKSGAAKLQSVLQHLDEFLDNALNGKLLIFAHHRVVLDKIVSHLNSRKVQYIRIDGTTNSKERHTRSESFQQTSTKRVAVLSITAGGIACTLTAAATVFFAELFWNPGALLQAEDRAHRIGQLNQVRVIYFFAKDSIDALLWPLFKKKLKYLGQVIEGHVHETESVSSFFASRLQSSSASASSSSSSSSYSSSIIPVVPASSTNNVFDLTLSDDEGDNEGNNNSTKTDGNNTNSTVKRERANISEKASDENGDDNIFEVEDDDDAGDEEGEVEQDVGAVQENEKTFKSLVSDIAKEASSSLFKRHHNNKKNSDNSGKSNGSSFDDDGDYNRNNSGDESSDDDDEDDNESDEEDKDVEAIQPDPLAKYFLQISADHKRKLKREAAQRSILQYQQQQQELLLEQQRQEQIHQQQLQRTLVQPLLQLPPQRRQHSQLYYYHHLQQQQQLQNANNGGDSHSLHLQQSQQPQPLAQQLPIQQQQPVTLPLRQQNSSHAPVQIQLSNILRPTISSVSNNNNNNNNNNLRNIPTSIFINTNNNQPINNNLINIPVNNSSSNRGTSNTNESRVSHAVTIIIDDD